MPDAAGLIAENLQRIRDRISEAARQAGRLPSDITLVAVTKYVTADLARALVAAGCRDLGESRPQELWRKAELLRGEQIYWHQIGHLQRNKVRRTLAIASLVHSVDSLRLLTTIDQVASELDLRVPVLLEVNISGDEAKHGMAPENVAAALGQAAALSHVQIGGLMAMSGRESGREGTRREFVGLRELRNRLRADCPPGVCLDDLSMGMSNDFDLAILEGATLVRVGSALFEGVDGE